MPFSKLLSAMVESVNGASGAIFLDGECEYVQYFGHLDSFRTKLLGAYQGILLQHMRGIVERLRVSGLDKIVTEYEGAKFITKNLKDNYYMVLVLGPASNIGQGLREIDRVAAIINNEIA
jgi:predicted regulator of Ras-like GTPase activity (Roadblock/LC7/MglB family)